MFLNDLSQEVLIIISDLLHLEDHLRDQHKLQERCGRLKNAIPDTPTVALQTIEDVINAYSNGTVK